MVTPVVAGASNRYEWGRVALPGLLGALARRLNARSAYFVTIATAGSFAVGSHTGAEPDPDQPALDAAARQWLAGAHGTGVRLSLTGDVIVDIAAVRGPQGESLGALLVARSATDGTNRATAAGEVELAAALIASLLDRPDAAAVRQSVLDWASTQAGGRTAFAVSIDGIGVLNDVLGYDAGDAILRALLGRIESWAGAAGRVACIGDARYLAIRSDVTDEAGARRDAERLRAVLAEPVDVGEFSEDLASAVVSRSASIGVCVDARGVTSARTLVVGALRSGALARAAGGDRVEFYDAGAAADRLAVLKLDLELYGAVTTGQLRMHYQPEFDLTTGQIVAVEGLLRWQHPERGLLGAESFVPATETSHTFGAVQRWVIDESCRQLAQWRAAGLAGELTLRLNVAAAQVVQGSVSDDLRRALEREQLPGRQICVELTERRIPPQSAGLADILADWRRRGISIAIDDFGTGDGTLRHVVDLPVDVLKIDQTFVGRMGSDPRAATVVASVISLATELGLDVVAEGVDGRDTVELLLSLGCRRGQGNALAEAQEPERVTQLLGRPVTWSAG